MNLEKKRAICFLLLMVIFLSTLMACDMGGDDIPDPDIEEQNYTILINVEDEEGNALFDAEVAILEKDYIAEVNDVEEHDSTHIFKEKKLNINESYTVKAEYNKLTEEKSFTTEKEITELNFNLKIIEDDSPQDDNNYAEIDISENTETNINEKIEEKEEAIVENTLDIEVRNVEDKYKHMRLEFEETPDHLLYREQGNKWFKYAGFSEIKEGEIKFIAGKEEIEVLPLKMKGKSASSSTVNGSTEGAFEIRENVNGNFEAELGYGFFANEPVPKGFVVVRSENIDEDRLDSIIENVAENDVRSLEDETKIKLKGLENGRYTIYVVDLEDSWNPFSDHNVRVFWEQDIYVNDVDIKAAEKEQIAKDYAPILFFNSNEEYFPMDIDSIFNTPKIDKCVEFAEPYEPFTGETLTNKSLADKSPYFGHRNILVEDKDSRNLENNRGSIDNITVYYSFIQRSNRYFLNYHMLYTYDPKTKDYGPGGIGQHIGEHIFDRESATIVLDGNLEPQKIIYGAHLPDQEIEIDENDQIERWEGGGISIDWDKILKVGEHPILSIAEGAHAVFPVPERYNIFGVDLGRIGERLSGSEVAGDWDKKSGDKWNEYIAFPERLNNIYNYTMENLLGREFRQGNSPLNFSGGLIPIFLKDHAKFPPFTMREVNPEAYKEMVFSGFEIKEESLEPYSVDILKYLLKELHEAKPPEQEDINKIQTDVEGEKALVEINWQSPLLLNTKPEKSSLPDGYRIYRKNLDKDGEYEVSDVITKEEYGVNFSDNVFSFTDYAEQETKYSYKIKPFTELAGYYSDSSKENYIESKAEEYLSVRTPGDKGKEATLEGRIVIQGEGPGQQIELRIRDENLDIIDTVMTDDEGYYTIPSSLYEVGDKLRILVSSMDNFNEDYIRSRNLNTWTHISSFVVEEGNWIFPDLDLYSYGLELISPAPEEKVSLPYQVEISKYERDVNDKAYRMYFYDTSERFIGNSYSSYYSEEFMFDGKLGDGSILDQDAYWYISANFEEDGFDIHTNVWGNLAYLDKEHEEKEGEIEILEVKPDSGLESGSITNFEVTVSFSAEIDSVLYVGFNNGDRAELFLIYDEKIVGEGEGTHTFEVLAEVKKWDEGSFAAYANISEYPHDETWTPLDTDVYPLKVNSDSLDMDWLNIQTGNFVENDKASTITKPKSTDSQETIELENHDN